jgi:hypothetical protein
MNLLRSGPFVGLCMTLLWLQGCSSWQVNQLAVTLPTIGPEKTLAQLQRIDYPKRDQAQYLLNSGILKLYTGDLHGSLQDLEQAKEIMSALDAVSITENFSALTTNETLRSYTGSPSDRILVHLMLSLGYLFRGDLDGARVEMLQANVAMKQLDDGSSISGQLASVRFLAGVIYEIHGELDDAYISYRRALSIIQERQEPVPDGLIMSLLEVAQRSGRTEEYQDLKDRYKVSTVKDAADRGHWVVFYFDGVVSAKSETRTSVFDHEVGTMVSIVLPRYGRSLYRPSSLRLRMGSTEKSTQVIEPMEARVREDLDRDQGKRVAAATVRAVAKYQLVREARSKDDLGGLLANIFTVVTEQADVRSWNMLPASIQVGRISGPLKSSLNLSPAGLALPSLQQLDNGPLGVVLVNSLNAQIYQYPVPQGDTHEEP